MQIHSRKVRSLTSYFFIYSVIVVPAFMPLYVRYHTIPIFFSILNAVNLARQLCAQIAKTV